MGRYVIGVDGGTESLRAGVFDLKGKPLFMASAPYPTIYPQPSWAEQNPSDWLQVLIFVPMNLSHPSPPQGLKQHICSIKFHILYTYRL